jgi:AcrR family transcriptional regulator
MDTEGPPVTHSNAAPAPTKRSVGKAKTREKISHAAKAMFMSHGFDGANLRAIAAEAGLSTGALFANFENKADLFNAIVVTEYGLLAEAFAKTPQLGEDVLSDLLALMDAAYRFFWPQLPFAQALFSTDWTSSPSLYQDREKATAPILAQIANALEQGKATGKVRKDLNTALISRTIATLFVGSLNAAIQMDQDQASTEAQMAETLKTLAKGWQP